MKLTEIFVNTSTSWNWVTPDANTIEALFTIGDKEYMVAFRDEVKIHVHDDPNDVCVVTNIEFKLWRNPSGAYGTGITNSGDAIQVFSAVTNIIKEYVAKHSPTNIAFAAIEKSRVKLYKRLVGRLPGYHYETWHDPMGETIFLLTKT